MTSSYLSEIYGLRDGRIVGIATRAHQSGIWNVYLANGADETSFTSGKFRVHQAATIEKVEAIFKCEELELRVTKPQNAPIPDRAIFDRDWGNPLPYSVFNHPLVAKKLGEIMRQAINGAPLPPVKRIVPRAPKNGLSTNLSGARMNKKQKTVLIVVAATVVAMLVFPPFHAILQTGIVKGLGYHLISDPPQFRIYTTDMAGTVDIGLLVTQWLGVLIVGGIAFFFFKD